MEEKANFSLVKWISMIICTALMVIYLWLVFYVL